MNMTHRYVCLGDVVLLVYTGNWYELFTDDQF